MLDPRLFRTDLDNVAAQLARRGLQLDKDAFQQLESRRKEVQTRTQTLQNERNTRSKAIGQAKAKGEDIAPLLAEVAHLGDDLAAAEAELNVLQQTLEDWLLGIPNILDESVPDGRSEDDNVEIKRWGEPTSFDFEPKDTWRWARAWA